MGGISPNFTISVHSGTKVNRLDFEDLLTGEVNQTMVKKLKTCASTALTHRVLSVSFFFFSLFFCFAR